jgi:glucose-6-phosphate dehydrogenase assembly protein OpcA
MSDTKVRQRVAELKKQLADKELWTREDSIRAMIEVIKEPENQGSKISAVKVINDMQGFNAATKTQVSGTVTHEVALDQLR